VALSLNKLAPMSALKEYAVPNITIADILLNIVALVAKQDTETAIILAMTEHVDTEFHVKEADSEIVAQNISPVDHQLMQISVALDVNLSLDCVMGLG